MVGDTFGQEDGAELEDEEKRQYFLKGNEISLTD